MADQRKKRKPMSEINVVPYIDVMLVLLIIFMVTAPMLMQGVKVDLPEASAEPVENQDSEPVIVSVDAAGKLYLNLGSGEAGAVSAHDQGSGLRGYATQPGKARIGLGRSHGTLW